MPTEDHRLSSSWRSEASINDSMFFRRSVFHKNCQKGLEEDCLTSLGVEIIYQICDGQKEDR